MKLIISKLKKENFSVADIEPTNTNYILMILGKYKMN